MSAYGDMPRKMRHVQKESFQEWIDEGITGQVGPMLWAPPIRSTVTGHRVSINDNYRPISTRHLNWRWWLTEHAMRMLARYMGRITEDRELRGEEWIGHHGSD